MSTYFLTSVPQDVKDFYAIPLDPQDLESGTLNRKSNVRPNRIFTADKSIILYKIGQLNEGKIKEIIEKVVQILKE